MFKQIKETAKTDPDADVRGLVKEWLTSNAPDALEELDFGDYQEEPAAGEEEPAPEEVPQESSEEPKEKMGIQELAEFIHSFYDRETGTFPKGPEGVAIMVGKKFGEQAEMVARKMVERMAPQQQDPAMNELARIKELARF